MANKRPSRHMSTAATQQRSPSRAHRFASPPQQARPALKIAEAILTLAEP
jgi:hypothetical protein